MNNQNAEIYYPPYLFTAANGTAALATRPRIVSLASITPGYGQSLSFELNSPNGLSQVVLVGLSAVNPQLQRHAAAYVASFSVSGQGVSTAPIAGLGAVAPPGYYQLIAIDTKGVPSPGVIVGLGGVTAPVQVTTPSHPSAVASNGGGTGSAAPARRDRNRAGPAARAPAPGQRRHGGASAPRSARSASPSGLRIRGSALAVPAGNNADGAPVTQQPCTGRRSRRGRSRPAMAGGPSSTRRPASAST